MIEIMVKDVLNLLNKYDIKLIAGVEGLSRKIETVSVLEIKRYDKSWIKGKELILTTLNSFESTQEIINMIKDLEELNVGAIGIHPGMKNNLTLDNKIIKICDEIKFPIIILPRNIAYSTIFSTILGTILNKQSILLKESEQVNKHIINELIKGGNIDNVINIVSCITEKPVILLDETGNILSKSIFKKEKNTFLNLINNYNYKNNLNNIFSGKKNINQKDYVILNEKINQNEYYLIVKKIYNIDSSIIGYILIWESILIDEYERELDLISLNHAATAFILSEIKRKAVVETEMKLNIDFLNDLLSENYDNQETLIRRADFLGIPIKGKHQVIIIEIDDIEKYYSTINQKKAKNIYNIKNELEKTINFALRDTIGKGVVLPKYDSFIVVLQIFENESNKLIKETIDKFTQQIHNSMNKKFKENNLYIGVGDIHSTMLDLVKSYNEARESIKIGKKIHRDKKILFYSELGLYKFLRFKGYKEFENNCYRELIELNENDSKDSTTMLDTLETYFDNNESLVATAEKMNVHPNTVKYRIKKVVDIIGIEKFEDCDLKLKIHIALKMRKLFDIDQKDYE